MRKTKIWKILAGVYIAYSVLTDTLIWGGATYYLLTQI